MKSMKMVLAAVGLALAMMPTAALADGVLDLLKPVWMQLGDAQRDDGMTIPAEPDSVQFVVNGGEFTVEATGLHVSDEYSVEANAYAVLRSTSESTQRIDEMSMRLLNGDGEVIAEEEYVTCEPRVVPPGGVLCVDEWLYDVARDISDLATIELNVVLRSYSYDEFREIEGAAGARVEGRELAVEIRNDGDAPLRDVNAIAVIYDKDGRIVDMMQGALYNAAIGAQSTYILYQRLEDYVTDGMLSGAQIETMAYVIEKLY